MPTLKAQSDILSQESLQSGVVEVIITRGARALVEKLNFESYEGTAFAFNAEESLPTEDSRRDPFGTSIAGGNGTNRRIQVEAGALIRNADTQEISHIGVSNINNQRADDVMKHAKKLAQDFGYAALNDNHTDSGSDLTLKGVAYWMDFYAADFPEQRVYGTNDGLITGTSVALTLNMVDDLLSRQKGLEFNAIYSNRETRVKFKNLYNAAGGNTGGILQAANFGSAANFMYDGVPWYTLDHVGAAKSIVAAGAITSAATTFVVNRATDPYFAGFSQTDVGRTITIVGAGAAAADLVTTIDSVTDKTTIEVADAAGTTVSTANATVAAQNMIIATRHDGLDGFTAVYHENNGGMGDAGMHNGPIAGFDVKDLGMLQGEPRYRTRLTWYGNYALQDPYAMATLSHFA